MKNRKIIFAPGGWAYTPYSQSKDYKTNRILGGIGQMFHQASGVLDSIGAMKQYESNTPQRVLPAVQYEDMDKEFEKDMMADMWIPGADFQWACGGKVRKFDTGGMAWASSATDSMGDIIDNFNNSSMLDSGAVDSAKLGVASVLNANTQANSLDNLMALNDSMLYAKTDYNRKDFTPNSSGQNVLLGQLNTLNSSGKAYMSTGNGYYAAAVGALGTAANLIGNARRIRKSREMARKANAEGRAANLAATTNIATSAMNIDQNNDLMNMRTFQAALGGPLSVYGGNYHTGLEEINEGGTHGQNPLGGVPISITPEGEPNLAEEGETVYQGSFVFSDRIKAPETIRKKYKAKKGATFADISKKVNGVAEERPNDPISKSTLNNNLQELALLQEALKAPKPKGHKFDEGGETEEIIPSEWSYYYDNFGTLLPSVSFNNYHRTKDNYTKVGPFSTELPTEEDVMRFTNLGSTDEDGRIAPPSIPLLSVGDHAFAPAVDDLHNEDGTPIFPVGNNLWRRPNGMGVRHVKIVPDRGSGVPSAEQIREYAMLGAYDDLNTPIDNIALPASGGVPLNVRPGMPSVTSNNSLIDVPMEWPEEETGSAFAGYTPEQIAAFRRKQFGEAPAKDKSTKKGSKSNSTNPMLSAADYMQLAPTIGSGMVALSDAFGLTNKPNYRARNAYLDSMGMFGNVGYTPKGTYASYTPISEISQAGRMMQNQAARRRGVINLGNGNRSQIMANLALQGYQDDAELAQLLSAIGQSNEARRLQVLGFNNDIDFKNAQAASAADQFNMQQAARRAEALQKAGLAGQQAYEEAEAARAANLSQFLDNLGALGKNYNENATINAMPGNYGFEGNRGVFRKACGGSVRKRRK